MPHSATPNRNADHVPKPDQQSGPTLLQLLQTAWIAAGVSFLALTIVTAATLDSFTRLTSSDDSYAGAFFASVPVAAAFAVGSLVGWRCHSTRIAMLTAYVPLVALGTVSWVVDRVYFIGEGEDLLGLLGVGILLGGLFGLPAFFIRSGFARTALSVVPHLVLAIGYLTAVYSMLN